MPSPSPSAEVLNRLAPWPDSDSANAETVGAWFAGMAQSLYARLVLDPGAPKDLPGYELMGGFFAAAHALLRAAAGVSADAAAAEIREAIEKPHLIGYWLSVHLGPDACESISSARGQVSVSG